MLLRSQLLHDTVQFDAASQVLILNSAENPFVSRVAQQLQTGMLVLAEDNLAALARAQAVLPPARVCHVAFHDYILHHPAQTSDIAILDLLYQPANAWMFYALQLARYALRPGGQLYVVGPKDRGILTVARRMQEVFSNVETLTISKGYRVLRSIQPATDDVSLSSSAPLEPMLRIFADSQLDQGTRLLLDTLDIHPTDQALDLGCGAGFIGLHIARLANSGQVTMVDASLTAVATARQAIEQSGLMNLRALPSNGAQAVLDERFDLVATNPPFHQGGIQTTEIAERFIRDAARVLRPRGRFYLVANRFLKYEPFLATHFSHVAAVAGDTRYKVLLADTPRAR